MLAVSSPHNGSAAGSPDDYRSRLDADGYAIVRDVLDAAQVGCLRRGIAAYLERGRDCLYLYDGKAKAEFTFEPDDVYVPLLRNPKIAGALRQIAGEDVVFANECGMSDGIASGWHKDTHEQVDLFDRAKDRFFGIYKVLIYLQDHLGYTADDFSLRVRKGSHWIPSPQEGEEEFLFARAGDAIIMDVRLSHRGRNQIGEGWNLVSRAAYYPVRRLASPSSYRLRNAFRALLGLPGRFLVTLLYGRRNSYTVKYMEEGRRTKIARFGMRADQQLPATWRRALESVSIGIA